MAINITEEVFKIITPNEEGKYNITRTQLINLFAKTPSRKNPFKPSDIITIGPMHSKFVKQGTETTIGIFIFNKMILEDLEIFGYYNGSVDGDKINEIQDKVTIALLDDIITVDQCARFIDGLEFILGGPLSHIINPSIPIGGLKLNPKVAKRRKELLKQYEKELDSGDTIVAAKIEKELIEYTKKIMKEENDPVLDLFNSKCGLKLENHYKTMFLMKGPVLDNTVTDEVKYNIITSNLNDGVSKKDFIYMADSGVTNAYAVGIATGESGYYTKKYNALYSDITLLPSGSNCNTKKTLPIMITETNKKVWGNYTYHVLRNGELELLTRDNIDKYVGKVLNMRSPMCCEAEGRQFCSKCYGELSYKLGKLNVGKTYSVIPNTMMNASLKKKHDITVHLGKVEIETLENFFK